MTEGKIHTHTHSQCGERAAELSGCQAVFTVFSLPRGLSSLGPAPSSSLFTNTPLFCFPFKYQTTRARIVWLIVRQKQLSLSLEYKL